MKIVIDNGQGIDTKRKRSPEGQQALATSMLMASFLILTLCNLNRLQSALQGRFHFV